MLPDFLTRAFAPESWPTFVFITMRLGGLMLAAPLWSMSVMPGRVRAAITVVLAVLLLPSTPRVPLSGEMLDLPVPLAWELMIGLVIGLTAAVIVHGVTLAGEVVSMQMGLSLGSAISADPEFQVAGVGQIKSVLAMLLYIAAGGHLVLLQGLAESLRVLPPGAPIAVEAGAGQAARVFGVLFSSAVYAGAPAMVALLLANIALALLSRAVPQLNAMMVGFPITIGIGLLAVGGSLPFVGGTINRWMTQLPAAVNAALESFRVVPVGR